MIKAHENICIRFSVFRRNYKAIGFLTAVETSVSGQTMLDRTKDKRNRPIDEDDWEHLSKFRVDFPSELEAYRLVTDRREPHFPLNLSCFDMVGGEEWCEGSDSVESSDWNLLDLVLRRCL